MSALFSDAGAMQGRAAALHEKPEGAAAAQDSFFANALQASTQAFVAGFSDGRLYCFNAAYEELTGYPEAELRSINWATDLTPPEWHHDEARVLAELHRSGKPQIYEKEYIRKGGDRIMVEIRVHLVETDSNGIAFYFAFLNDVTARKNAERALRESEQRLQFSEARFRSLVAATTQLVWTTDPSGRVVEDSLSWRDFTGQKYEEWVGFGWVNALHPDDRERARATWQGAVQARQMYDTEYRIRRRDGVYRWMTARGVPVLNADGAVREWVGANTDITERLENEQKLKASEERLRLAVENAGMGTWDLDFATGLAVWSKTLFEMLGYVPDSALVGSYQSWVDRLHPEDRDEVLRAFEAARQTHSLYSLSYRIIRADNGNTRWLTAYGSFIYENGEARRSVGLVFDETQRRAAQEASRAAHERTLTVLDSMTECYIEMDADWRVTFMNRAAATLNKVRPEDVIGKTHWEIWPWCNGTMIEHTYRQAAHDNTPAHFEFFYPPLSVWVESHAYPTPTGLAVYFRDVTDEKRVAREREQLLESERAARAEAERSSRTKDEFLATLSHELRTPLNAILGWALLLGRGHASEEDIAEGVQVIERNARAQAKLIEDLLDMSRIITGKLSIQLARLSLRDVISAAVESVGPTAAAKGLRIETDLDIGDAAVMGDAGRLQQIVWNLLTNAVKFTRPGGLITVAAICGQAECQITIADNGEGISPDFLPFLFQRFSQADATTRRKHGGLGIGLALVKQLVELHGGAVRAESPGIGRGSAFIVNLPIAPARHDSRPASREPHLASGEISFNGAMILVLDDEPDAREIARRILAERGARVSVASNADEGVALAQRVRPDLIISDIGLPGKDGYDFIRAIRALPAESGGAVPAIALTAFARPEDKARVLQAGFQSHVPKPLNPTQLIAAACELLRDSPEAACVTPPQA